MNRVLKLASNVRLSLYGSTIVFVAVVCMALVGLDGQRAWNARGAALADARTSTSDLAHLLAQHADGAIATADTVLLSLRERVESDGTGPEQLARLHRLMRFHDDALPLVHALFLFDEHGDVVANSLASPPAPLNYADRTYFQWHREHSDLSARITGPFHSKSDGSSIMVLSRRVTHANGTFAGVILGTMSTSFFQSFYQTFDVGPNGTITLAAADGTIIAKSSGDERRVNATLASSDIYRDHIAHNVAGSFEAMGTGGLLRVGSFHYLPQYPLLIVASRAKHDVLARWQTDTWTHFLRVVEIASIIAFLGRRVAGQIRERQKAEMLYRLLAEYSSDAIVCMTLDGKRRYVSPAMAAMTGWTAEEMFGKPWKVFVHPDDEPAVAAMLDRLRAGEQQIVSTYRYLRKDGSHLWVEARCQLVAVRRGAAPEFVGNIRDVTTRKLLEDQLTAANAGLTALSATDGLTGLANRRHFDAVIAKEWGRAAREQQPLSLLLLDADFFKSYNDAYGHPAGDEILKVIAECTRGSLRRAADVAARYGGEEFAVILPGTDQHNAILVAEQIRAAVTARRLPHCGSGCGTVSISVGVASMVPHNGLEPAYLVEVADTLLYTAKRNGRNRIEADPPSDLTVSDWFRRFDEVEVKATRPSNLGAGILSGTTAPPG